MRNYTKTTLLRKEGTVSCDLKIIRAPKKEYHNSKGAGRASKITKITFVD